MDISLVKIELISSNPDNKLPKGKLIIPKGQSLADVIEASKKYKVQWSGANNPLWYISAGEWKEIDADKQPVGKFVNRKPFTDHIVQLNAGDHLFLFSDGFADQFGGEKGKKIKNKALKDLLYKNSEQAPEHQKQALEKEFDQWKEGYEQVDDVCVIGIKL
jgi:serine phosphatase RsbU (regulator of sigma subunit)